MDAHSGLHPETYYGTIMDLVTRRRGIFIEQEYPAPSRVLLTYDIPLAELIDFYDQLKSRARAAMPSSTTPSTATGPKT